MNGGQRMEMMMMAIHLEMMSMIRMRMRRMRRRRRSSQLRLTLLLLYLLMSLFPHLRDQSLLYHYPPPVSLSPPSAGERLARCMAPSAHSSPPHMPSPLLPSFGCPTQVQTLRIAFTQALIDAVIVALPSPPLPPSLYIPPLVDYRDDILESEQPPRKRLCLSTLGSRYDIRESFTARPIRSQGIDYGFVSIVDAETRRQGISEVGYGIRDTWVDLAYSILKAAPMTARRSILGSQSLLSSMSMIHMTCMIYWRMLRMVEDGMDGGGGGLCFSRGAHQAQLQLQSTLIQTHHQVHETRFHMQQTEMAELRDTDRRRKAQMVEMLRVMRDMRREMSDMQAELLAHREQ
nr:hypothetical protein [Tanacetum cinerariifolium]